MPTADIWQKNSLKYTGQPKVTLLESSYCKHFPSRIPLSTWFWSISTPEKLLAFKIWLSRSNFTFYERADWWKKIMGCMMPRTTGWSVTVPHLPRKMAMTNRSGTDSKSCPNLQQAQTLFLLKYMLRHFLFATLAWDIAYHNLAQKKGANAICCEHFLQFWYSIMPTTDCISPCQNLQNLDFLKHIL